MQCSCRDSTAVSWWLSDVGGVLGALVRVGLAQAAPTGAGAWPWATFAVNMAGALALGYIVTRLQERLPPSS